MINPTLDIESSAAENERDETDIITDQDQTMERTNLQDDKIVSGPVSLNLEDEPTEFLRGDVDVFTQIDRTARIVDANVHGHHDLDDSPDTTPGGVEEVAAKTDEDLARRGHMRGSTPRLNLVSDFESEEDSIEEPTDLNRLSEEVDLTSRQIDYGEMNEKDARESGYLDNVEPPRKRSERRTGTR